MHCHAAVHRCCVYVPHAVVDVDVVSWLRIVADADVPIFLLQVYSELGARCFRIERSRPEVRVRKYPSQIPIPQLLSLPPCICIYIIL